MRKKIIALALFIQLLLSAIACSSFVYAGTTEIGQTVKGNSSAWQPSNVLVASSFTASSNGVANSISVYIYNPTGSTTGSAKCAIYGSDKTLVASTEQKTISAGTNGWVTFNFVDKPSIKAGTSYSLTIWFSNSGNRLYYSSGDTRQSWYAVQTYRSTFPDGPYSDFNNYNRENLVYSIYCSMSTSSSSTTSPTTTPTPTTTSSSTPDDLISIPSGWWIDRNGQYLDTRVTFNGMPSIRLDKTTWGNNPSRECNSISIPVKPGDHVVFSCWMKTTASGYGDTNPYSGARIGIDFYDYTRITTLQSPTYPNTHEGVLANYVHWGTSQWTLRTIEITIPQYMPADGYWGHSAGGAYTPTMIILWMQVWSSTYGASDPGQAWFANPQITITR